ncbi:predicted protein [Naegleria gruberi]|uniref:Predicted protein n=1 Tax=Naegleria gruberi TaxID=5762 RepID=D2VPQ3_NAEGR|nr:uncharacterized protein NAEGRDRAFT_70945 [Naegleria gruberi]EFC41170.1 predicted protein [Naegleria gruberi]|eukprot:XP_002673914.1 predicted protein [Naegleria gruberi strain NEG-M]
MHAKHLLISSGLVEICWAIVLGWYLALSIIARPRKIPPFNNFRRVLQAHIDYILMGMLQMGVAVATSDVMVLPDWVVKMFVFGAWANASSFLIFAVSEDYVNYMVVKIFSVISFLSLTIVFPYIAMEYISKTME